MTQVTRTYDDAEWQLAPKNPTTEMLRARDGISNVVSIYRTMLAAAPQPPAEQSVYQTCSGHGLIGGPSFHQPDEGGVPCPDCAAQNGPAATDDLTAEAVQFMAIFDKACEQPDPWAYLISAANLQTLQWAIDDRLKRGGPIGVVTDAEIEALASRYGVRSHEMPPSGTIAFSRVLLDRAAGQGSEDKRDAVKVDTVHAHFTPFYLLANARQLANREMARSENWVLAMKLFAVGSTSAHRICEEAGIDPDGVKVTRAAIAARAGSEG